MYSPTAFVMDDLHNLHATMRQCRTANFITATVNGPMATLLPMIIAEEKGENGVLYAHLARANDQWRMPAIGNALAVFVGPEAYVTPSWYLSKQEHGKVVPTWNYAAVHASGPSEFFDNPDRLLDVVDRLTNLHEEGREKPWSVGDAPAAFITAQLGGIVGMRMPIVNMEGKRKMSQNRPGPDRAGVKRALSESSSEMDRNVSAMIPR
ncbi:FMN-binding negative transcriptional regulator [Sinorhizobium prairiense]|uniref:FMN-binding negative transcriptional regulator n=1 Tax=unclassified Sinorhizobium TaxID=2613772 RepID=UPI0023D89FE1|nr:MULTISPECIES: FMN-binding negative transcriptional regulator [unclassified Sinorhizobium]WEJ08641.1 FMN-binding negative transcriptional regulator [Sinorhizobium sp. M103]WEJ13859.1 FMN-binding negative transcriptional regulator [Sinorhizobium sp. K101]WEJ35454.1 FMN-binding negative transcriptional regulator [Sinorhizobium sp. C101]